MPELPRRSNSVYDYHTKQHKDDILSKKINLSGKQLTVGIIIGIFLSIVIIILQCIAYSTPHWKEISPKTHSLYVDNVDALIRTEILIYFNSVHRFTHHSYGLFQRCGYLLNNSSKLIHKQDEFLNYNQLKICTKNFLPSYDDEQFNKCHSLQYYRFCSQSNEKIFNINNDYLRATFDILSSSDKNTNTPSSCDCHYPKYIKVCQIFGIFIFILLFLTTLFFSIFSFLKTRHQRLKIKCFGVLSSIFATLFIFINLLIILNHLEYESMEYLTAIETHYRSTQIYKLSQDAKHAINKFQSSIDIQIGYSTILAWITFGLSIIDGILFMITCKITGDRDDIGPLFSAVSVDTSQGSVRSDNNEYQISTEHTTDFQRPSSPFLPPTSPPPPPNIAINENDQQSSPPTQHRHSCLKHNHSCPKQNHLPRIHFEDEV